MIGGKKRDAFREANPVLMGDTIIHQNASSIGMGKGGHSWTEF
jgi:hypothetical protein